MNSIGSFFLKGLGNMKTEFETDWRLFDNNKLRMKVFFGTTETSKFFIRARIEQKSSLGKWLYLVEGELSYFIKMIFPELENMLKWNCFSQLSGPENYIETTKFWWNYLNSVRSLNENNELLRKTFETFKAHTLLGVIEDDSFPSNDENIEVWCKNRLPKLIEKMKGDVEKTTQTFCQAKESRHNQQTV